MISQATQTPVQPSIGLPSVRIYTLGPLGIEWIKDGTWTVVPEEHFQVRGGTIALQNAQVAAQPTTTHRLE